MAVALFTLLHIEGAAAAVYFMCPAASLRCYQT